MFGSSRLRKTKKKNTEKWRRALYFTLLWSLIIGPIILVSWLAWYFVHLSAFTLQKIEITGGETVPHQNLEAVINQELNGTYYHLVPKRFAYFYPEEEILNKLRAIPRIKDISVHREDGRTLIVSFTEYKPHALWCSVASTEELQPCFFIDDSGVAFAEAPSLKGSALLRYVDSRKNPAMHEQAFSYELLRTGKDFSMGIGKRFNLAVEYLERVNDNEIFVHLSTGGVLKISGDKPVEDTLNDLAAIFADKQFAHLTSGNFIHIDLRYGNKVFVQEKEIVPETTEVSEEEEVESVPVVETQQ